MTYVIASELFSIAQKFFYSGAIGDAGAIDTQSELLKPAFFNFNRKNKFFSNRSNVFVDTLLPMALPIDRSIADALHNDRLNDDRLNDRLLVNSHSASISSAYPRGLSTGVFYRG